METIEMTEPAPTIGSAPELLEETASIGRSRGDARPWTTCFVAFGATLLSVLAVECVAFSALDRGTADHRRVATRPAAVNELAVEPREAKVPAAATRFTAAVEQGRRAALALSEINAFAASRRPAIKPLRSAASGKGAR